MMKKQSKSILKAAGISAMLIALLSTSVSYASADEVNQSGKQGEKVSHSASHKGKWNHKRGQGEEPKMTFEDLKSRIQKKGKMKLEEIAKEKGITVEELQKQMKDRFSKDRASFDPAKRPEQLPAKDREAKLEELAKKKGISLDELKAQMVAHEKERFNKIKAGFKKHSEDFKQKREDFKKQEDIPVKPE